MTEQHEALLHLWAAVIQTAVNDIVTSGDNPNQDQRMSRDWVESDSLEPRSFLWACDMLNVGPIAVRAKCGVVK